MFTQRQIAVAGFFGVYAGCLPLTVNLARLPYWRGALIGVFFGALMHLQVTFIYILLALFAGWMMNDAVLESPATWGIIAMSVVVIQALTSLGCQIMGRYFMSPGKDASFDRRALYEQLKARDTGKKSVLHDVVVLLETRPAAPERKFSSLWTLLFGTLSVLSLWYWLYSLTMASLDVLFFGVTMDAAWWLGVAWQFGWPLLVLIAVHIIVLNALCHDVV